MVKLLKSEPAEKQNFRLFLLLIAFSGARPGKEVRGIRWEDVDFEANTITIRNEVAKYHRGRTLDLHPQLKMALQSAEGVRSGSIIKQRDFRTAWTRACEKNDIEGLVPYGLRKLFATEAIYSGVELQDLQYMMGHTDPKITMQIYVEVRRFKDRKVASLIPSFEEAEVIPINKEEGGR
jgi:integrase